MLNNTKIIIIPQIKEKTLEKYVYKSTYLKKNCEKKPVFKLFSCCLVHSQFAKNPIFMALKETQEKKRSFIAVIIYERLRKFSFDFDFAKQT